MRKFGYKIYRIDEGRRIRLPDETERVRLREEYTSTLRRLSVTKAHYGSGGNPFGGDWVNIDISPTCRDSTKLYMSANLASGILFLQTIFAFRSRRIF